VVGRAIGRLHLNNNIFSVPAVSLLHHKRHLSSSGESRYLITGGQGFIGAWIVKYLLDENTKKSGKNKVTILDAKPDEGILGQVLEKSQLSSFDKAYGDVSDTEFVQNIVDKVNPDVIIHMAALQIPTCKANPILGAKVNVVGTLNIFEAVRKLRERTKHQANIVYASSAAVSGDPRDYSNDAPILDDAHHTPLNHYGVFKIANEGNARVFWHDHKIPSVALRPFTVYGVGREVGLTSSPTKAIKAAILGRPYTIPFSGSLCINYAEDMARIFVQCGLAKLDGAYSLNIKGEVISVDEWIKLVEKLIPSAKGTIKSTGGPLPFPIHFDESGLSTLLNEKPVKITPVLEGIKSTIQKFKELNDNKQLRTADL